MPLGAGRPKARASLVKAAARLASQSFKTLRPPTLRKVFVGGVIFQQTAFADDLLFLGENFVHVVAAQAFGLDDDFGEHVFRFAQGQAQRRLQQTLAAGVIQFNVDLLELFDVRNDSIEQRAQVRRARAGDDSVM